MSSEKNNGERFSYVTSLVAGTLITMALSGTLVIAGLQAGILPGVSPLVILFAWGAFSKSVAKPGGREFLNVTQVVGSAGVAVTAGVIFSAPVIQILYRLERLDVPNVDVPTLIYLCIAGALVGSGFVAMGTKAYLTDKSLPAPEARSCYTMIEAAVTDPGKRPNLRVSMFTGLGLSALAPLVQKIKVATEHVVLYRKELLDPAGEATRSFQVDLPYAPIYFGIGALLTLPTAILVFGGSFLRLLGEYILASSPDGSPTAAAFPAESMRWIGGGAMTVAVLYSLVRLFGLTHSREIAQQHDPTLEISKGHRIFQAVTVVVGFAMIAAWLFRDNGFDSFTVWAMVATLVCCGVMVVLGALLSLQIGSSASPVSGTVFVTMLVLCIVAIATGRNTIDGVMIIVPLMVAACVAICAANDSSQDFKTLQLCGVQVQRGFIPQLVELIAGSIAVPCVLYIAHDVYELGSKNLVAPQASMFATVLKTLLLNEDGLSSSWRPIAAGLVIGVLSVVAEIVGKRKGLQLPSMALAVGIYLPPYLGVGIMVGALARYFGDRGAKQRPESILAAAGLIAGAAMFELILGGIIVLDNIVKMGAIEAIDSLTFEFSDRSQNIVACLGIASLIAVILVNSRIARSPSSAAVEGK
ncbi:MAG: OPT/YSL family transporter [Planctomycetales bacterium]|nr:OPT/YSL family transporter [Planctomycetales bacterium]